MFIPSIQGPPFFAAFYGDLYNGDFLLQNPDLLPGNANIPWRKHLQTEPVQEFNSLINTSLSADKTEQAVTYLI